MTLLKNLRDAFTSQGYVRMVPDPKPRIDDVKKLVNWDIDIDQDKQFGGVGRDVKSFDAIAPGVYRLITWDGLVIGVDTTAGTIGPTIVATTPDGVPLMAHSYVFFGESTPPGVGFVLGD